MTDCDCGDDTTGEPQATTQHHMLLMLKRETRNGQPKTTPATITPAGALKIRKGFVGMTGVYRMRDGGVWHLIGGEWRIGEPVQRVGGVQVFDPGGFGVGGA